MAVGHNIGLNAQTVLGDDEETLFHYAQWHIGDYVKGTEGMALEIEGAYIRFLMRLYRRGKPLPDDDKFMTSAMGLLTTRVWRRIRNALVELGKIIVRNGCLTNARFERERQARAEEIRKRSAAATARWERNAKKPIATAIQGDCNGDTTSIQTANVGKKRNKINETALEVHMLTNNHKPITIKKESPTTADSASAAAPVSLDEVEGLNGTTLVIQTTLAKWIRPIQPDYRTAREWLTTTVQIFGSDAVKEAFAVMKTKMASGDIVGAPLKLMTKICQEKKRELDERKQPKPDITGLEKMSEAGRKQILADREIVKNGGSTLWS